MRKAPWILALAVTAQAALVRPLEAEVTKTVRLTQDASRPFAVENLAGAMKVVAGSGTQAEVTATLHAESQALLDAMRFEPTTDDKGRPSLRVRYPENERRFRYPQGESNTETKYDGRRIKVTRDSGVVAYADLEVRLPKDVAEALLRNGVGALQASGVSGNLRFDTGSGDITVSDVAGDVVADTGSRRREGLGRSRPLQVRHGQRRLRDHGIPRRVPRPRHGLGHPARHRHRDPPPPGRHRLRRHPGHAGPGRRRGGGHGLRLASISSSSGRGLRG